ncbi:MAG: hypothetical protein AB1Z51_08150 [Desulfuromonadales bacterium]
MGIEIKPSDLYYKYRRNKESRNEPKFTGKPDPHPYDRDDLYDVIPMLGAVMDELGRNDAEVLHRLEELAGDEMPQFIVRREEVFDFLVAVMSDMLGRPGTRKSNLWNEKS